MNDKRREADDAEVNRWRNAITSSAAQIAKAQRGFATNPTAEERNFSMCMVHSLLNRTLDSSGAPVASDEDSSAPELEISEAPTPRSDSVQLLSKDAISELVTSIRGMSHNLSTCTYV